MSKAEFTALKAGDAISSAVNGRMVFTVASVNLVAGIITTAEDGHFLPYQYWGTT